MRILCTSNPLVGHWLPMLPLAGMYIPAHLHVLHGLGAHSGSRN
jgi:hypothetical protein